MAKRIGSSLYLASALVLGLVGAAAAESPRETRTVSLVSQDGTRIEIARLEIDPEGRYAIAFSETAFSDHFLSMRPFKCLEGPDKHWCHVPYPYEIRRSLSEDLVDLEYDLLFLWKGAADYGIDTWNGIYYVLEPHAGAAGGYVGMAHEIDLGTLAVPPAAGDLRPVRASDLHDTEPDSQWLPGVVIE